MLNIASFEPICYVCKKYSKSFKIHESCKNGIFFDNLLVLYHYKNQIIKKLIIDAKFYSKKDIFIDFWLLLSNKLKGNINLQKEEEYIIVATPLHFFKKLKRWYNQSHIISKSISHNSHIKYNKNLIYKVKHTRQQSQLSKTDRANNLHNSFKISKIELDKIDNIKSKTIIIVDDVISTWTTINEISKLFKKQWCKKIIWLIIASD